MKSAPLTPDEEKRIEKLHDYEILDTISEQSFDDLTELASYICGTPIALVSLVDRDRQWFKSKVGLDAPETPRDVAFCSHAIHGEEVFHIPDSRKDERFHDNPLVTGAPHVIFYAGAPIVTPEGHKVGTLCVIDDKPRELSDEQKDALTRLSRQVSDQLEARISAIKALKATAAKSEFLANMSHELRTPLNAIIGYSEILIEDVEDGSVEITEDLEKIHSSGIHLLSLINQVLDLSKIESGKMDIHLEETNVSTLIADLQSVLHPIVKKTKNKINFHRNGITTNLIMDFEKVKQILINLVANSAKFTNGGKIDVNFNTFKKANSNFLKIDVVDTGIGISKEKYEKIFASFTQADGSTTREYGGTGLGLSICKQFAELMGGEITVESEEGKGSTFSVIFPAELVSNEETHNASKDPTHASPAQTTPNCPNFEHVTTALIIDSDENNVNTIQQVLHDEGISTTFANNAKDGLAMARKVVPDIIILEVKTPDMNGWSTLTELKQDPLTRPIPVVMMSMNDNQEVGFSMGASDYISKPINKDILLQSLGRVSKTNCPSILIVDDDEMARDMMRKSLQKIDSEIYEAHDGTEALKLLNSGVEPAIILLDLMMPKMDGFEFLFELRRRGEQNKYKVIVVSSKTLRPEDKNYLDKQVEKVAQKGKITPKQLAKDIEILISKNKPSEKRVS